MAWFAMFVGVQLIMSLLPSLEKIRWLSLVGFATSISYSTIAIVLCGVVGIQPGIGYGTNATSSTTDVAFGALKRR
jgi:hypothetical protein